MKTIKQLFLLVAMLCAATSAWAEKEAYVVLTSNTDPVEASDPMYGPSQAETLTFYYDENKASHGWNTGWETLRFNVANFDYNGTSNLVVVVCRRSDNSNSNLKYCYESKSNHVLYRGDGSSENYGKVSNTSSSYSRDEERPSAQFMTINFSAQDFELTDAGGYSITENMEVSSATYKKTLAEDRVGKYQAWFVPFEYAITDADLEKFDFFKINMIANAAQPGENPFYYVNINGQISRGTTVTVGPYRWILRATAKGGISYAPTFSFIMDGETTAIHSIDNGQLTMDNGGVYDLQGRRVAQPTKGLYIVNGRKVVVK